MKLDLNDSYFKNSEERNILGTVCRNWNDGKEQAKHYLNERREFLTPNLQKALDLFERAKKDNATSFEDFLTWLEKKGNEKLSEQFYTLELNASSYTGSYYKKLLRDIEAPCIGQILSNLSESVAVGAAPVEEFISVLTKYNHPKEDDSPIEVLSLEELTLQPKVKWLVDGILPANALSCIYGPPGSGKSFFALDMALSIASGEEWRNRETSPGSVLYIAGEGISGLSDRVNSWVEYHDYDAGNFPRFSAVSRPIDITGNFNDLIKSVRKSENTTVNDSGYGLIVIDTLARCFGPNDENSTSDMQRFILALDHIRLELNATVLVVHHSSKAEKKTLRGNSALEGCLDTLIKVESLEKQDYKSQRIFAKVVKQKDAEGFQKFYSELIPQGDSAVLQHLPGSVVSGESRGTEAGLLQSLKDMIHSEDQWIAATQWRKAYPKMGPDFGQAVKRLVELGHVEYKHSGISDLYRLPVNEEI